MAFDLALFTQSFAKCSYPLIARTIEDTDHWHWRLLRARRERPCRSAAEQGEGLASSQGWHGLSPPRAAGFSLSLARKDWQVLGQPRIVLTRGAEPALASFRD